jgi:hypothetical protein
MRTSAKLNLFLGVRNLSEEFLPAHLAYLQSYFRRRPINLLFPVSVTVPTLILIGMVMAALEPGTAEAARVGLLLVTAMLGLAIIEHWMLVLPLPTSALWRWAMRRRPAAPTPALAPGAAGAPVMAPALVPALSPARSPALEPKDPLFHAR